jgi:hypothetical protein
LQDWKWDGVNWSVDLTKDIIIKGEDISYSLSANITSAGYLGVFIPVEYTTPAGETISEILTYSHFLEGAAEGRALEIPVVPTLSAGSGGEEVSIMLPTPTPDYSILSDDNLSASQLKKNIAGLVLIGISVIATLVLILWQRKPVKNV